MSAHIQAMQRARAPQQESHSKVHVLTRAIDSFNGAATRLENYYQHLERRIDELNGELRIKNVALEAHLREKEEVKTHLHNILECLPTGIIVIDLNGSISTINNTAEKLTGISIFSTQGKSFDEAFAFTVFRNSSLTSDYIHAIKNKEEIETEVITRGERIFLKVSLSCLRDQEGKKVGTILALQDITEIKRLEIQANRNNRLAAMGEMAAKMAHEIRNPLGSIELFVSVLKKGLDSDKEHRKIAEHISSGVRSINGIISNLLMFIRPHHKAHFKVFDIHEPLQDSLFFSSHLLENNEGIEVKTNCSVDPLMVEGDGELLKQVFLNLILNAIQAMSSCGRLDISTREIKKKGSGTWYAEIRFADTGIGIPRDNMKSIFDPFFTTKKRGTGLGLSIVHNIVESHNGTIEIESKEGSGTACIITLPLETK